MYKTKQMSYNTKVKIIQNWSYKRIPFIKERISRDSTVSEYGSNTKISPSYSDNLLVLLTFEEYMKATIHTTSYKHKHKIYIALRAYNIKGWLR